MIQDKEGFAIVSDDGPYYFDDLPVRPDTSGLKVDYKEIRKNLKALERTWREERAREAEASEAEARKGEKAEPEEA